MNSSRTTAQNLQQKICAEADAWLEQAGETGYTLGTCQRQEESWFAVAVDGQESDYHVYVRLTPKGSEIRDDRVLTALNQELTELCREELGDTVLCTAWVNFCAGMPAGAWYPTDTLAEVAAREALCADWYLLAPEDQEQELHDLAAGLAVDMRQAGWVGVIHAAALEQGQLAALRAAPPEQSAWAQAAEKGSRVRVSPDDNRTREQLIQDMKKD